MLQYSIECVCIYISFSQINFLLRSISDIFGLDSGCVIFYCVWRWKSVWCSWAQRHIGGRTCAVAICAILEWGRVWGLRQVSNSLPEVLRLNPPHKTSWRLVVDLTITGLNILVLHFADDVVLNTGQTSSSPLHSLQPICRGFDENQHLYILGHVSQQRKVPTPSFKIFYHSSHTSDHWQ